MRLDQARAQSKEVLTYQSNNMVEPYNESYD